MPFTVKLLLAVAFVWAALMPPLFTDGACTAEFDAENARLDRDRESLKTAALAEAYWRGRAVAHAVLSTDDCRKRKPRNLESCGDGPLIIAKVPVMNLVCRVYRDDEIAIWLQYDARDRLVRQQADMSPYKSLPIPFTGRAIHWAR
ncbi:MAG TPA: hypothetical protein VLT89_03955 [Usitatibacter sp.]|nr:hypothetical protein [Usitatibacter sp.]